MLSQAQLAVLEAASHPLSMDGLAERVDVDETVASVVADLVAADLAAVDNGSDAVFVDRRPTPVSEALDRACIEASHVDIPDLCTPIIQRVCWFLDRPHTPEEVAAHLNADTATVRDAVDRLHHRAMLVERDDGAYVLQESMRSLNDLSRALARHTHHRRVREFAPGAHVLWASPCEAIVAARDGDGAGYPLDAFDERDEWEPTGLHAFLEYDLRFLLARPPLFHYSVPSAPDGPEHLACRTLLTGPDHRRATYALVLLADTGWDSETLERAGKHYGMPEVAVALDEFFESKGDVDVSWFPSWEGVLDIADQYDVTVPA